MKSHYGTVMQMITLFVRPRLLQVWREEVSPQISTLPVVGGFIDWMWPTPTRQPLPPSQSGLSGSMDYLARSMSAGLLLPFAAYIVGLGFTSVTKNNAQRVILVSFYTYTTI